MNGPIVCKFCVGTKEYTSIQDPEIRASQFLRVFWGATSLLPLRSVEGMLEVFVFVFFG